MTPDWKAHLLPLLQSPETQALRVFVAHAYSTEHVLPPKAQLLSALDLCSFEATRVVILGQDPYPTPGQAHGLAFSVLPPTQPPPSLRNMLKEIESDVGPSQIVLGDLTPWAKQGVLLLNTILTTRAGAPLAHANHGWEPFTDAIIRMLSEEKEHLVFLLWGSKAKAKIPLIDASKHLILTAAHPSPLSAFNGFFGCRHFSKANAYLAEHGLTPIRW